jgi:hypothetical protein
MTSALKNGAVGPADAVVEDLVEHRQPVQHPPGPHGLDRGVIGSPVTETTDLGGRPRRTRSSTSATAARPRVLGKGPARKSGGLRVTQVVVVTRETSSSS